MTDYFLPRRLIQLLDAALAPKGYVFSRWTIRGEEEDNSEIYEFVFTTPRGSQEVASGVSRYELENSTHKMTVIAGALANRVLKKIAEIGDDPPPSPS